MVGLRGGHPPELPYGQSAPLTWLGSRPLHPQHRRSTAGEEEAAEAPSLERRLKKKLFRGCKLVGFVQLGLA